MFKCFPNGLKLALMNKSRIYKYLDPLLLENISWVILNKFITSIFSIFLFSYFAKSLSLEDFGVYSFSVLITTYLMVVSELGIQSFIVKRFIISKQKIYLVCSIFIQLISSLFFYILFLLIICFFSSKVNLFIFVTTSSCLFSFSIAYNYFTEASNKVNLSSKLDTILFVFFVVLKIIVFQLSKDFFVLSFTIVLEYSSIALIKIYALYKATQGFGLTFTKNYFKKIFTLSKSAIITSFPIFIGSIIFVIILFTDQIMLLNLSNITEVTYYNSAFKLVSFWDGIILLFSKIFFYKFVNLKNNIERDIYFFKSVSIITCLNLFIIIFLFLFGENIIKLVFTDNYSNAYSVLILMSFSLLFSSFGHFGGKWYFINNLQKLIYLRLVSGFFINFLGNLLLIPSYGSIGAAYSSLITYIYMFLLYDFINVETKKLFTMKIKSFYGVIIWVKKNITWEN